MGRRYAYKLASMLLILIGCTVPDAANTNAPIVSDTSTGTISAIFKSHFVEMATSTIAASPIKTRRRAPSPTEVPTRYDFESELITPASELTGNPFAKYWSAYLDPDDKYGFAYPIKWVFLRQPDQKGSTQWMKICNLDESVYSPPNPSLKICVELMELPGGESKWTLESAVTQLICTSDDFVCGEFTLISGKENQPDRVGFLATYRGSTIQNSVYRTQAGLLIWFFSTPEHMTSKEVRGIVDSFAEGEIPQIEAPPFKPSPKLPI